MGVSQFARGIAESPTMALNEQARVLREQGESVVHLGIGEPQNAAPQSAIDKASAALAAGKIKYTPTSGIPSFKKAVVQYTEVNYGRTVAPRNIIVCSGAKQAIFNALWSILDAGDEVILLAPYWVSYPEMVKMCRAVPVVVTPKAGTLEPSLADIERAVTPRTRAIIVNSPNNPSGMVFSRELVGGLVRFCEDRGIHAIMDDIYHKLVFDGVAAPSCYEFTTRDADSSHLIVINGIAKTYGMTGFRIGWAIANREIITAMCTLQSQTTSCTSSLCQLAAEGAILGPQDEVEELRKCMQHNRDVIVDELAKVPGVTVIKPSGTFYCLPDFSACFKPGIAKDSFELAMFLLSKARVVTIPGRDFGMEGYLRLSYAGTTADAIEGVRRIRWALDETTPKAMTIGQKTVVRDWL
ncbi:MAG TPA: pyridoxal phosphate-dependent aminotransferase [Vicinamibacterales bacterium]|jgi:aspartate aminotransferase